MARYYRKKYGNRRYKRYLMGRSRRFRSHRKSSIINSKINLKTLGRTFKKLGFRDTKTIVLRQKQSLTFGIDDKILLNGYDKGYSKSIEFNINNTIDKRQLFSIFNIPGNGQIPGRTFPYLICKYQLIKVSAIYVILTPNKNSFDGRPQTQGTADLINSIDTMDCNYNLYDDETLDKDTKKIYDYMSSLYRNVFTIKSSDSITFCIKNPRCIRKGDGSNIYNRGQYLAISEIFNVNNNYPELPFQNNKNNCLIEEFHDGKFNNNDDDSSSEYEDKKEEEVSYGVPMYTDIPVKYSFGSINFYKENVTGTEKYEVNVYYKCTVKN